jgi:two-component system NtrC family sensor kinase
MPLSRVPWWKRLGVILPAVIALGTLLLVGTAALLFLQAQERHLVNEVQRGAALFSETIKSSTYHDMLADRRDSAYLIMDTIGRQAGIDRVRFFNKEGRVTFSSDRSEINTMVDKRAEQCYGCHEAGRPLERLTTRARNRTYESHGHRVLGMVTPIYNEAACSTAACHAHPAAKRVLGVIDIGISLAEIDAQFAAIRRNTMLAAAALVLVLGAFVGLVARRTVVRPVADLVAATRAVAAGDYGTEIRVATLGELGALEHSFNEMIAALAKARAERQTLLETLEQQVEERTAALKEAQAQLVQSEKLSSLGRLAASIAHEINNPLAGIRTYARLLRRQLAGAGTSPPTPEQVEETDRILEMVDAESGRCGDIVRNLLAFSRQTGARFAEEDLAPIVDRCRLLLNHQAELLGVTLETRVADGLPRIVCDAAQVQQMILALAMNALEATPANGRVSIEVHRDGDGARLVVSDTGSGIPKQHQDEVFEPFFTTKESGSGVGLGLAVVYGLANRHGARIDLESEVGKGTTFTIHLPARPPEQATRGEGSIDPHASVAGEMA